jgi:hypothetical protein
MYVAVTWWTRFGLPIVKVAMCISVSTAALKIMLGLFTLSLVREASFICFHGVGCD